MNVKELIVKLQEFLETQSNLPVGIDNNENDSTTEAVTVVMSDDGEHRWAVLV